MIQAPEVNLDCILPELILVGTGCLIVLAALAVSPARRYMLGWLALLGVVLAGAVTMWKLLVVGADYGFGSMIRADDFTHLFRMIFLIGTGITILISIPYVIREGLNHVEYYALILFCTAGMMLMAAATDLIIVFLALELFSISLYVLSSFARKKAKSQESGLKYLLIGGFSAAFLLYGIALVYGVLGSTDLYQIGAALAHSGLAGNPIVLVGMALIIVGLGFKVALVPFHMWTPDVYEGAPTSITAYMSVGAKAAGFAALLRIMMLGLGSLGHEWGMLLSGLAVLTLAGGNLVALAQHNIKRLLAYSAISHAGYITIGLVARNEMGLSGVLYYLLGYAFTNLGAFAVIIALGKKGEPNLEIRDFAGLSRRQPIYAALLTLFLLSLAGIPLTVGFIGKLYIFIGAIEANMVWLAIVGVLASAVAAYYYLRVVWKMYMETPAPEDMERTRSGPLWLGIGISAIGVLVLGIMPSRFIDLVQLAAKCLPMIPR